MEMRHFNIAFNSCLKQQKQKINKKMENMFEQLLNTSTIHSSEKLGRNLVHEKKKTFLISQRILEGKR